MKSLGTLGLGSLGTKVTDFFTPIQKRFGIDIITLPKDTFSLEFSQSF